MGEGRRNGEPRLTPTFSCALARPERCLFWEMQSRCHIKYNSLPFPPRLRLRPRRRLSLSLSLPFYGTPLDFHGNRGTLTLGLAVARRLCENYRPFPFFPIAPSFQENAANLSLSRLSFHHPSFPLSLFPPKIHRDRRFRFLDRRTHCPVPGYPSVHPSSTRLFLPGLHLFLGASFILEEKL